VSGELDEYDADFTLTGSVERERFGYQVSFVPNPEDPSRTSLLVGAPASSGQAAYLWADLVGSGLDNTAGTQFWGGGYTAQHAGDVDGDGIDDLAISNLGKVFVVSGPCASEVELASSAFVLVGEGTSSEPGADVAVAGDGNGDGYDDILIGDPFDDEVGDRAGKAWLVRGPVTATLSATMSLSDAAARLLPESANDSFGFSAAGLWDVNGDGAIDIAVSAPRDQFGGLDYPGKVYIFSAPLSGTISAADADLVIQGRGVGDWAGAFMDGGRDIDSDGNPDLLIAAPFRDEVAPNAGEVDLLTGLSW